MAQIYKTGGSGKNYVYNPDNGNIMVNNKLVQKGNSLYDTTYKAMVADTGYDFSKAGGVAGSNATATPLGANKTPATATQVGVNKTPATPTNAGKDVITNAAGGTTTNGYGKGVLMRDNNGDIIRNENGVSYREPAGTAKNEFLSNELATNNGGIYRDGTTESPEGYSVIENIYNNYLDKAIGANKAKTDAAVKTLQDSIGTANKQYDATAQGLYTQYQQNMKSLPQLLAAQGLGRTGVSETSRTKLMGDYMNNLYGNENNRAGAIQNIMNQIAQTQAQGQGNDADIYGNYANNLAQHYSTLLKNKQDFDVIDRDYRTEIDQYNDAQDQLKYENQLQAGQIIADQTGNNQPLLNVANQGLTGGNNKTNGTNSTTASNGQVYLKGGSGKQYVYNPSTGNIIVTVNGVSKIVKPTDSTYQATKNAMNSDTGSKY